MLDDWHDAWTKHIRPNLISPARLHLSFVCDVADNETGVKVVQPFLAEPEPVLAQCSIRLSHRWDLELQRLAERAVAATTEYDGPPRNLPGGKTLSSFRFLDLPTEIRHHILAYTELVTPFHEVEWNPSHGMYFRYKMTADITNPNPHSIHGSYGASNGLWRISETPYLACWEFSYPSGCFCSAHHAAYSTVHRCTCWAPPTPIFLASRAVREDALQIFFSRNRFVVAPTGGETRKAVSTSPTRLPISMFLTEVIPKEALRFLRFLEIVFPAFGELEPCAFCPSESLEWHDWIQTLESVKDKLDLPKLTIRAHFAWWLPAGGVGGFASAPPYRAHMTEAQSQAIQQSYSDTLTPLRTLRGLSRFFAHLPDPTEWVEGPGRGDEGGMPVLEQKIERMVMSDEYDSAAAGKAHQTWSRWFEDHEPGPI